MRRTGRPERRTVPINVIADGRAALVVGGGKVGRRKARLLAEAGVPVELVDPVLNRAFRPGDCAGKLLVFACTDDKHANRAVLEDARRHRVPCCVSDMNWADGDFTTPATVRAGGAVIGVSTGGASCSGAKRLKEEIADFLNRRSRARVTVLGTSDRQLAATRRSAFHLPPAARREMLGLLREIRGVDELVVLETCNRVEVALYGDFNPEIVKRLMRFHRLAEGEYYQLEEEAAFAHLVRVTAGLESAFAGEFHVVSQVKDALEEAIGAGALGGRLKGFFDDVLRTAKDVRHAIGPLLEVKEIDRVAVERALAARPVAGLRAAVLGTGRIGRGVLAQFAAAGVSARAVHHGEEIPPCDVLVCACACAEGAPVVTEDAPGRLVIDLGMPPNCAPGVARVSLDDLKDGHRAKTGARTEAFARADGLIAAAWAARAEAAAERNGGNAWNS